MARSADIDNSAAVVVVVVGGIYLQGIYNQVFRMLTSSDRFLAGASPGIGGIYSI